MKTVGIIAEYNPFHNGHAYLMKRAKELTGADYCIVVMSGNFMQRGVPALMNKWLRTKAALSHGADLVLELPVHYASGSAEYFASGAVALLDRLGVTDTICFGSECGDIDVLSTLSEVLLIETPGFRKVLKEQLKLGVSYPRARDHALSAAAPQVADLLPILQFPNNILGIEYIKAIKKRQSKVQPYTLARLSSENHTSSLETSYNAALTIRKSIQQEKDIRSIREQVPPLSYEIMEDAYLHAFPIMPEDLSALLPYKLLLEQDHGFDAYLDIDTSFSDRLIHILPSYMDYSSFCEQLKTKNMTYTRVSRNLLHILLDIYQADMDSFIKDDYVYYARLLGFNKDAEPLFSAIKKRSDIPLISKLADANNLIDKKNGRKMLSADIRASHIYALLVQQKFGGPLQNEYKQQIIVM